MLGVVEDWLLQYSPESKGCSSYQPLKKPLKLLDILSQIFRKYRVIQLASYSKINITGSSSIVEYDLVGLKIPEDFNSFFCTLVDELNNYQDELETFRFVDLAQENVIIDYLQKGGYFS